ncbi:TPA: M14 family metallopeptidase [Pseudomonas putida]|nr:M14 family metallopeptidase [Pseudomonas putida]
MNTKTISALFSQTYAESRTKFLAAAQSKGLAVESYELDLKGAQGETLATDVVVEGPLDASRMLIVISGVHGVEGFTGSAVQTGLLGMKLPKPADTSVLYVHAINPFGFSHLRRVTQENVDLNRNFIDFDSSLPQNPGYEQIHDALLPQQWPPESDEVLETYRRDHGDKALQQAMSIGQYRFEDGMWFGGKAPTWSNDTFRTILRKYTANIEVLVSIDIHTGLGPFGYGEKIFAGFDHDTFNLAQDWWGELTNVHTGTSTSVAMSGPIQSAIVQECARAQHIGICLEYGTCPFEQVITALRADHWAYRYGMCRTERGIASHLKDTFYPDQPEWQQRVWEQGEQAVVQALDGLAVLAPQQRPVVSNVN